MIEDLPELKAILLLRQIESNSVPIELLASDGEIYFAKTIFKQHPPFEDLINEVLCHYLLKAWGIFIPDAAIITISEKVFESFIADNKVDQRYLDLDIKKFKFFATKKLEDVTEYNKQSLVLRTKHDYNKLSNPLDFIKISVFDNWMANKDRRINNPNLLLQDEGDKFRIVPIDHVQAFAYQSNYKGLKQSIMNIDPYSTLLGSQMLKTICKFANSNLIANLHQSILINMKDSVSLLDDIFTKIPSEFGLSKAGKSKIMEILSDESRNSRLSKTYLNYQK